MTHADKIMGLDWSEIQRMQQGGKRALRQIDTAQRGDYGADPVGDGTFRMVPSGDIVELTERNARLSRYA